jgi:transcriptional regulator with XRE-family HTH domain
MSKGEIIKTFIKDSGLSVTEIAKRMNVDRRTIYSYMKKDNLKPDTLRKLSIACGKSANFLLRKMLEGYSSDSVMEDQSDYLVNTDNINNLKDENRSLLKKLVKLQEKHIKLHEEYLKLKDPEQ